MDAEKRMDSEEERERKALGRRGFLKGMGAAALGTAATTLFSDDVRSALAVPTADLAVFQTSPADEAYWRLVKARFPLLRKLSYLNTGTEGSMSHSVLHHLRHDLLEFAQFPYKQILENPHTGMGMLDVRTKVAAFMGGVEVDEIVMTTNTTEGLGFIASGTCNWKAGDEILTHLHFMPYNGCALVLKDRYGINMVEVEIPTPATSASEIVDLFEAAITPNTKLMMFCNINFSTGLRMPVKELCELAAAYNICTLIDGAHALGMIDVDLKDIGCDFYAASCHKWLCGPPGTGVLFMRRDKQKTAWPTVTDSYTKSGQTCSSTVFQLRGQQCTPAYASLLSAIDLQNAIGKARIEARILALHNYAKEKLSALYGEEKVLSPQTDELSTGLVSFNPFETPYDDFTGRVYLLYDALYNQNIVTRTITFQDKLTDERKMKALRLSTHLYNSYRDIDKAIDAIEEIVKDINDGKLTL